MTDALLSLLRRFPPVRAVRRRRFERVFRSAANTHLFDGDFPNFAAAIAAAPDTRPSGYDHAAGAAMYRDRLDRVFPEDLPLAATLANLAPASVLDFGGHVGVTYYAMRRLLGARVAAIPWTIVDLPAVVDQGRAVAQDRMAPLAFHTSLDGADADVFLASGVLQYVEDDLPVLLGRLRALPRAIILHKTPLTAGRPYITLNAIGTAFCPYVVCRRADVFGALEAIGYQCVESWLAPDFRCVPWDRPDLAVVGYTGAAFVRTVS